MALYQNEIAKKSQNSNAIKVGRQSAAALFSNVNGM